MITREQIAKMIYGYMEYMEYDVSVAEDLSGIPDGKVSAILRKSIWNGRWLPV